MGTLRIWFFVFESAFVSSMPRRLNRVKSVPNSVSAVVSGLRSRLPACASEQPVVPQLYVSYCAVNDGVLPAVPCDARRRKSVMCGTFQNDSSDTRHTPETRPNGAQRLPAPNSELPS